ncbi:hypothetical protein, partial [Mesotoga prima]
YPICSSIYLQYPCGVNMFFSVNGEPLNGQPVSLDFPAPDAGLTTHKLHLGTNLGFHILFSAIET